MENLAQSDYRPLDDSLSAYKRLTGLDQNRYDMYAMSEHVLDQSKGLELATYVIQARIGTDNRVTLPCDVYNIRSVTRSMSRHAFIGYGFIEINGATEIVAVNQVDHEPLLESALVWNEKRPFNGTVLGPFLPYQYEGEHLTFSPGITQAAQTVDVVFDSMKMDCRGEVLVTRRVIDALAHYMEYMNFRLRYNQKLLDRQIMIDSQNDYFRAINQARVPSVITDNEWNQLLDVYRSHNRKQLHLPYRAV